MGLRLTSSTSSDYDIQYPSVKGGYNTNSGEQYTWEGTDLGVQAIPTTSSGTTLTFPHSAVDEVAKNVSFNARLLYSDGSFSVVVVSGAGAGQIRQITGYSSVSGTNGT